MTNAWLEAVREADKRVRPYIRRTPLEYSPFLSQETGTSVFLKCEMLQITGSFKLRGAANKLLSLSEQAYEGSVITASTGNHGAGVLHMANQLGIAAEVYLPVTASKSKVNRLRQLGATIRQEGTDSLISEQIARQRAEEKQVPFISPYNDREIIAGQGTMTLEIMEQLPEAEAIFVPVGGGGLISGAGAALRAHSTVKLVGCQPENSAVMHASIKAGEILDIPSSPTLSDGTAGGLEPDSLTFPLCQQWVDQFIDVSEEEIADAMRAIMKHHHFLIEGAAGLALAALQQQVQDFKGKSVVLVLCGRNVSLEVIKGLLHSWP